MLFDVGMAVVEIDVEVLDEVLAILDAVEVVGLDEEELLED